MLKASEKVLDRLHVENSVKSTIGYPYRTDTPLWNERAVRELIINAIVHNDYFNEVPPKFEIFYDRLEITSTGSLPDDMSKEDFFGGVSNPRNKELMRVFRDVELVESLGTGLQRVLQVYGKECFVFMDHFIRVVIPFAWLPNEENHPTNTAYKKTLIIEQLIKNPSLSRYKLAEILGMSVDSIKWYLEQMQESGYIRHVGPNKGGHWEIVK